MVDSRLYGMMVRKNNTFILPDSIGQNILNTNTRYLRHQFIDYVEDLVAQ